MNDATFFFLYGLARQSGFFDGLIIFFAEVFPYVVILLAGLFLIFYRQSWKELLMVFFSGSLAVFFDQILKYLVHAPRPFTVLSGVYALFPEIGYAFPSGHAAFFSALATSLLFLNKKIGYLFMFFAFLIGLARIIAGVHFPIDILGGFVLGITVSYLVAYFVKNV